MAQAASAWEPGPAVARRAEPRRERGTPRAPLVCPAPPCRSMLERGARHWLALRTLRKPGRMAPVRPARLAWPGLRQAPMLAQVRRLQAAPKRSEPTLARAQASASPRWLTAGLPIQIGLEPHIGPSPRLGADYGGRWFTKRERSAVPGPLDYDEVLRRRSLLPPFEAFLPVSAGANVSLRPARRMGARIQALLRHRGKRGNPRPTAGSLLSTCALVA